MIDCDTYQTNLRRLQEIAGERQCGPVGIRNMARHVLKDPQKAGTFAPLLPWVLEELDRSVDQDDVVSAAIASPSTEVHETLLPHLPRLLGEYASTDTAHNFIGPACAAAKVSDPRIHDAFKPHFPAALEHVSWASHNFGLMAKAWLDMGGEAEALRAPLQALLARHDKPEDPPALEKELTNQPFVELVSRIYTEPGLRPLRYVVRHFAGTHLKSWISHDHDVSVLASTRNSDCPLLCYAPPYEHTRVYGVCPGEELDYLRHEFNSRGVKYGVLKAGRGLFEQIDVRPFKDAARPAYEAVIALNRLMEPDPALTIITSPGRSQGLDAA